MMQHERQGCDALGSARLSGVPVSLVGTRVMLTAKHRITTWHHHHGVGERRCTRNLRVQHGRQSPIHTHSSQFTVQVTVLLVFETMSCTSSAPSSPSRVPVDVLRHCLVTRTAWLLSLHSGGNNMGGHAGNSQAWEQHNADMAASNEANPRVKGIADLCRNHSHKSLPSLADGHGSHKPSQAAVTWCLQTTSRPSGQEESRVSANRQAQGARWSPTLMSSRH